MNGTQHRDVEYVDVQIEWECGQVVRASIDSRYLPDDRSAASLGAIRRVSVRGDGADLFSAYNTGGMFIFRAPTNAMPRRRWWRR